MAPSSDSSVSSDTENKLAHAGQSAQRLAQSSEPSRDDNTLDLFHDDPVQAASVAAARDPAVPRRTGRAKGALPAAVDTSRRESEGVATATPATAQTAPAQVGADTGTDAAATSELASAVAAVETAPEAAATATSEPMLPGQALAQAHAARAAVARRPAKVARPAVPAAGLGAEQASDAAPATAPVAEAPVGSDRATPSATNFASAPATTESADATPRGARAAPELDRARTAAFADTVDALQGVIADQRRAAADLSRRMRWMLGVVVGALLVTVAAGVAQTIVLSRLATDASAQQQRIAQMMQDQQTALAGVLARLDAQTAAPAVQAASESAARPAHHPQHTAAHAHRVRPATR